MDEELTQLEELNELYATLPVAKKEFVNSELKKIIKKLDKVCQFCGKANATIAFDRGYDIINLCKKCSEEADEKNRYYQKKIQEHQAKTLQKLRELGFRG